MITEKHTASLGGRLVDIIKLRTLMEGLSPKSMKVNDPSLTWQIEPNHHYWNGLDGKTLGPDNLLHLTNWETAEIDFPNWSEHIRKVKNANLNFPIWLCDMPDMHNPQIRIDVIFDGMHRYTRAVIDKLKYISVVKVKYEDIPEEYFIK